MKKLQLSLVLLLAAMPLALLGGNEKKMSCCQSSESKVTGTAGYRERMALLPGAEMTIKLVDVSLADAPAVVIDEQVISLDQKSVPVDFELSYDPEKIQENHTYAVQAAIRVKDKLAFITDQVYPVLTRGAPDHVDLLLVRVPRS